MNPWSIQIELTEGCNRRCSFCGIHSLYREKKDVMYKHMEVQMARQIAHDLASWLPKIRLEFALQGEPLLNPNHLEIFQIFREEFPTAQIMVTSNCDPLKGEKHLMQLFQSGVNILVADYYGGKSFQAFKEKLKGPFKIYDFHKDKPKVWGYVGTNIRYIVAIDNTIPRNFHRDLNNQAGNTSPTLMEQDGAMINHLPVHTRCHLPFREMSIKHDGAVPICCMDWQRENIMGKFPEQSFKEIWAGEMYRRTRSILYNKERRLLDPCKRCNYHAVKVGLVEDPYPNGHPDLVESSQFIKKNQVKSLQNKYANQPFNYSSVTEGI